MMSLPDASPDPEIALATYKNSPYRLPLRALLILINIVFVMYLFLMLNIIDVSDYAYHIEASAAMAQGINIDEAGGPCDRCPHHLFNYITIAIETLIPGENFKAATMLTALLAYITLAVTLATSFHRQLRGRHPWQAVGLALMLMLTGPLMVFSLTAGTFQQSFVYLHPFSYHSPTMTLMRPLTILVFLYAASALIPPVVAWGQVALAALVTFLLGNAKPSFSLPFVPAAVLVGLYRFRKSKFVDYRVMAAILGVMLLLLGSQYLSTFNSGDAGSSVAFMPFAFLTRRGFSIPDILVKHLLSCALPLAVLALYWREVRRDGMFGLAWLTFGFGLFIELFFVEQGDRLDHGNFYWTGEITLFVLLFASVHVWLRAMGGRLDTKSTRARVIWVIWALHIVSGVFWYVLHLTA